MLTMEIKQFTSNRERIINPRALSLWLVPIQGMVNRIQYND